MRRWRRDGLLTPGQSFGWQWSSNGEKQASINVTTEEGQVILSYRQRIRGGEWQDKRYPVSLEWTDCHLGGHRPWFLCPAKGCRRRVALLYGSEVFVCRHCLSLAYPSQRETDYDRAARRADRIRDKLDWEPGILNGNGLKPKDMHWRTFERLSAKHDAFVSRSLAGMAERFNIEL
ncbi:MAG: hypothetical protein ABJQ78_12595 [Alloalcanivorax sp.]